MTTANSNDDITLEKKREKARRYAQDPGRIELTAVSLRMISDHGPREVRMTDGEWICSCDFFPANGTCSHIMAAQLILETDAGMRVTSAGMSR